ncbi:MAG: glycosyltransferase [Candidatus Aminicenantes bacterium]|nr:glycosyltransferase [Candidatus Aminicenantes bacterium]
MKRWCKRLRNSAYARFRVHPFLEGFSKRRAINRFKDLSYTPTISVITPVYNIALPWLCSTIQSVLSQLYPCWQLCLADDASTDKRIPVMLHTFQQQDPRIRTVCLEHNRGISAASNAALALASGEFVAFLDHDDELHCLALYEVARMLNRYPDTDLIFTDEDKLTLDGKRRDPVRKPGWSPKKFLNYNYLCHLVVCRKELVDKVGGFREGYEGSQDYDLLLRVTEITDRIRHIPKVLYHWRMVPGSAAQVVDAKGYAFERSKQALRDAMIRRGIRAEVLDGEAPGTFRVLEKST